MDLKKINEPRKQVKCKNYFWGFCKQKPLNDEDNNCDFCALEKCKNFKIKK